MDSWTTTIATEDLPLPGTPFNMVKRSRPQLEQCIRYWEARMQATRDHRKMPTPVKDRELSYCGFWLEENERHLRSLIGLGIN